MHHVRSERYEQSQQQSCLWAYGATDPRLLSTGAVRSQAAGCRERPLIAPAGSRGSPVPYCHDCICGFASLPSTFPTQPLAVPHTHTISNAHLQPRWCCILHISNYTHRQVAPAEDESFHCASFSDHGIFCAVAFTSAVPTTPASETPIPLLPLSLTSLDQDTTNT